MDGPQLIQSSTNIGIPKFFRDTISIIALRISALANFKLTQDTRHAKVNPFTLRVGLPVALRGPSEWISRSTSHIEF